MTIREVLESLLLGAALNGILAWSVLRLWRGLRLDREGTPRVGDWIERLTTGVILAAALVVLIVTAGGIAGILDHPALLLLPAGLVAVTIGWWSRSIPLESRRDAGGGTWSLPSGDRRGLRIAVAILLLGWVPLLWERLLLPPVAWDALMYHLRFPVLWLQTGSLVTSPAPFGDPSHAYFPLVGEMLLYWSMISTGTDLWTSVSQVPFALAACGATAGLAMRMGAGPGVSLLAGLCWLATPSVLRQTAEAMVDVELAAFFLCAIYFATRFGERRTDGWLYLTAASLGLLVGTKYAGVLFALGTLPVLVAAVHSPGGSPPRARVWAGAAVLAVSLGGYAYLRNWTASGNPFLPIHVALGDTVLLPGLLDPDHYYGDNVPQLNWSQFVAGTRAVLEMGTLFPILLGTLVASCLVRGHDRDAASRTRRLVSLAGVVSLLLVTVVLPYRVHRFVYGIPALSWAVIAALLSSWPLPIFALRIALPVIAISIPVALFYWEKDIVLAGPYLEHWVGAMTALGLALGIVAWPALRGRWITLWRSRPKPSRNGAVLAGILGAAVLLGVLAVATVAYERARFDLWSRYWSTRYEWKNSSAARADFADMAESWRFLSESTRDRPAVIAFAGTNLSYPLDGFGRMNHVVFVPREGFASSLFRWGTRPPDTGASGTPATWKQNLARSGAEYLCVYRLPRQGTAAVFPIERVWADQDSGRFEVAWARPHARVYHLRSDSSWTD